MPLPAQQPWSRGGALRPDDGGLSGGPTQFCSKYAPVPRPLQVRVVEFNASTPFRQQLETMASTTVLVSVHTSNLANAQFMQPGSAVFEIIQRNWFWHGLDKSFQASRQNACMPTCTEAIAVLLSGGSASVLTPTASKLRFIPRCRFRPA